MQQVVAEVINDRLFLKQPHLLPKQPHCYQSNRTEMIKLATVSFFPSYCTVLSWNQ